MANRDDLLRAKTFKGDGLDLHRRIFSTLAPAADQAHLDAVQRHQAAEATRRLAQFVERGLLTDDELDALLLDVAGGSPRMNLLYYGDNLEVLRRHVADESVDLVYLDPPFNSNANYNVLFAERDGTRAAAQIRAFKDTWKWTPETARTCDDTIEAGGRVSEVMRAFKSFVPASDMLAYLAMMAPRLVELRRVLKPTGSLYLHCDPTASHYLKVLLDAILGPENFRNEIVWERTTGRKSGRQFGRVHDVILLYSKSGENVWNPPTVPQSEDTARGHDLMRDDGGLFR